MSVAQNLDLLSKLKLPGMIAGYDQQRALPDIQTLGFDDRLTLMLEYEWHQREAAQTTRRLQRAKLKYRDAAPETLIFQNRPGLDQALILKLCECDWVAQHLSLLIVGPTGSGKSFLACSLATECARKGYTVHYVRIPRLLHDLGRARTEGTYSDALDKLAKIDVLVCDDWGLAPLADRERRDWLEVLEDRAKRRSTVLTSQLPVEHWYDVIGQSTVADAIMDRLVHASYRITLSGRSMRRLDTPPDQLGDTALPTT